MTPAEVLIAARERIAVPERWTQGSYARDAQGKSTVSSSANAVCWCSMGALYSLDQSSDAAVQYLMRVTDDVVDFNDHHTHPEVLAAFDRAIVLANGEAALARGEPTPSEGEG